MSSNQEEIIVRHIFARDILPKLLSICGTVCRDGQKLPTVTSGFAWDYKDELLFITAGHCIKKLNSYKKQYGEDNVKLFLGDGYSSSDSPMLSFPLPMDQDRIIVVDTETKDKADFAIIRLPKLMQQALRDNGVVPFNREENASVPHWKDFDIFYLFGFPRKSSFCEDDIISHEPTCIPLGFKEIDSSGRFKGKITSRKESSDFVKGMSGGPIVGIKNYENSHKKWVMAIQSSQVNSGLYVYATTVDTVIEFLEQNPEEFARIIAPY